MKHRASFISAIENFKKEAELQLNELHSKVNSLEESIELREEEGEPTTDL